MHIAIMHTQCSNSYSHVIIDCPMCPCQPTSYSSTCVQTPIQLALLYLWLAFLAIYGKGKLLTFTELYIPCCKHNVTTLTPIRDKMSTPNSVWLRAGFLGVIIGCNQLHVQTLPTPLYCPKLLFYKTLQTNL